MKNLDIRMPIFMSNVSVKIPNVFELKRLGAGHDGVVYRYDDLVFKLLKYDIDLRKQKDLMTFEKAYYFMENLDLKRIAQPIDVLFDSDGKYTGYVMRFLDDVTKDSHSPHYQVSGDFTLDQFSQSAQELEEDVSQLSSQKVMIQDLNRGSYIFTKDYLHMCDMDKFRISNRGGVSDHNRSCFYFFLAKALYFEMFKSGQFTSDELKTIRQWVRKSSNSTSFLKELLEDCHTNPTDTVSDYAKYLGKRYIR